MPRALWSGSIGFGLVNVPVKLVGAIQQKEIRFHQVHAKDGARIRYKRVCEEHGKEVDYEEIAKVTTEGVMLLPEELEGVEAEASGLIEITDFVKLADVDPIYFEKPYYLIPDKAGEKAYRLLVDAMTDEKRVAIASFVFRGKEKLVVVRPLGRALTLTMMNYANEVLLPEDVDGVPTASKGKPTARETKLARSLVDSLASPWEPEKYKDRHRERVLDLIEVKKKGGILLPTPKVKREATRDLADALEASLAHAKKKAHKARA